MAFDMNWYCIYEMAWNWPCVLPRKSMKHSTKSLFSLFYVYLAALTEQVTLHVLLSVWCKVVMQAEQERGRKGGLSSNHTGRAAAFTNSEALEKAAVSLLLSLPPLVLLQFLWWVNKPWTLGLLCFIKTCGGSMFSWFADLVKYTVQQGICSEVIYWQCRLRCKIHTCCS